MAKALAARNTMIFDLRFYSPHYLILYLKLHI